MAMTEHNVDKLSSYHAKIYIFQQKFLNNSWKLEEVAFIINVQSTLAKTNAKGQCFSTFFRWKVQIERAANAIKCNESESDRKVDHGYRTLTHKSHTANCNLRKKFYDHSQTFSGKEQRLCGGKDVVGNGYL